MATVRTRTTIVAALLALVGAVAAADMALPDFRATVLTDDVPNARQMALAKSGLLFVGTRRAGNVYAVVPADDSPAGDPPGEEPPGEEPEVVTVASGLTMPSGVAMIGNDLYVAALDRILRYRDIETTFRAKPEPEVLTDELPDRLHHGWKYLSVGPDGFLYVNVGAPCNVCESEDPRFASILRMDPTTGDTTVYAHGVRNSVGMAWHPETGQLWFTDNGRDMLGDDVPPEEINVVTEPGAHFGYPYIHGRAIRDPRFGVGHDPEDYAPPEVEIQAHSAALGMAFYTGDAFPAEYAGALFIAEHGSWNRSAKVGYRVSVVRFGADGPAYAPFIDIWLRDDRASARPNDVLVAADGTLLISDDQGGRIYRVTHANTERRSIYRK